MLRARLSASVLGLGIALSAAVLGSGVRADAAEIKRVTERIIPFESGGQVTIENKNGRITVEGWPRSEVRVQITRSVRAGDDSKAGELLKELKAEVEIRDGRIGIVSRFPKRQETIGLWDILGRKVASLQIHYYVQVPRETGLTLGTSNGEVRIRGVDGALQATTTNGDVTVSQAEGQLKLETTNGEIEITNISGTASARTTNGSVVAELRRLEDKGQVELKTTNGNVALYCPDDLRATLEAATTNGRVSVGFPLVMRGVMSSKAVRGTIRGGGATISLATTNGNVDVRRLGERRP